MPITAVLQIIIINQKQFTQESNETITIYKSGLMKLLLKLENNRFLFPPRHSCEGRNPSLIVVRYPSVVVKREAE